MPVLLFIEFVDELVFGGREAAWPLIRDDLALSYLEIGILLGLPTLVADLIEMPIYLLADGPPRRALILGGGVFFILAALGTGLAGSFWLLLAVFIVFGPASGAFVALSQSSLMDQQPHRREQNMARWELAGAVGVLVGTSAIAGLAAQEISWRIFFLATAACAAVALLLAARVPLHGAPPVSAGPGSVQVESLLATLRQGISWAVRTLCRLDVIRWLALLELADLVGDVLLGYLALYLVDVGGATAAEAALGVGVGTVGGLAGDVLVVALLERMRGLTYLWLNSILTVLLLGGLLLAPDLVAKIVCVGALSIVSGGRYAILKAQLYAALPERSASVLAVGNVSHIVGSLLAMLIGAAAAAWGLGSAMWLLMLGPLALLVATPKAGEVPLDDGD